MHHTDSVDVRHAEGPGGASLVAQLLLPENYFDCPRQVDLVETPAAWVFLTDRYVYKLKKPVRSEWQNLQTPAARRRACEAEVRLNRRLAADVYLDVVPVTQDAYGQIALGGKSPAVDWLVKMCRLPAERTMAALIRTGHLTATDTGQVADALARFYSDTVPLTVQPQAYREGFLGGVERNHKELSRARYRLCPFLLRRVYSAQLRFLRLDGRLLDERACDGRIVDGHGDLRPEHIFVLEKPKVIHCVDGNAGLRRRDAVDELCFLALECERLGKRCGAALLEHYACQSGDRPAAALLSFYKTYRAYDSARHAAAGGPQDRLAGRSLALDAIQTYLELADQYARGLRPPQVILVAGLTGTGKSTLAAQLAAELGAELIQTASIQRVSPGGRCSAAGCQAGEPGHQDRDRVYEELFAQAGKMLEKGLSVVLDGTFLQNSFRRRGARLAHRFGAAALLVHCRCPAAVAQSRIAERRAAEKTDSAQPVEPYDRQRRAEEPLGGEPPGVGINTVDSLPGQIAQVLGALCGEGLLI